MSKALVIDDNRQIADSLAKMLSFFEIESHIAYSARAGLTNLKSQTPSIVFLDLNMPGLTGFDILSYVKREPRLNQIPVVVVTSDDQPESAERAIKNGASAYIIKPATLDTIEAALKSLNVI